MVENNVQSQQKPPVVILEAVLGHSGFVIAIWLYEPS